MLLLGAGLFLSGQLALADTNLFEDGTPPGGITFDTSFEALRERDEILQWLPTSGEVAKRKTSKVDLHALSRQQNVDRIWEDQIIDLVVEQTPLPKTPETAWAFTASGGRNGLVFLEEGRVFGRFVLGAHVLEIVPINDFGGVNLLLVAGSESSYERSDASEFRSALWDRPWAPACAPGPACGGPSSCAIAIAIDFRIAESAHSVLQCSDPSCQNAVDAMLVEINKVFQASTLCDICVRRSSLGTTLATKVGEPGLSQVRSEWASSRQGDIVVALIGEAITGFVQPPGYSRILPERQDAIVIARASKGWETIAHELGHLLGGRHKADPKVEPFRYGHGWGVGNPQVYSVVGSGFAGVDLSGMYSAGPTYGATLNDNACVFRQTAPVVAAFHP